jgi:pilus assembly protein TadC
MTPVLLIIFSAAISVFIIYFSLKLIYHPSVIKRILTGLNNGIILKTEKKGKKKSSSPKITGRRNITETIRLILKYHGSLSINVLKIRTMGGFYLFRVISSASIAIFLILLGFFFGKNFFLYAISAALITYFLLWEILKAAVITRSKKILGELPDVIDFMASLVSAGLTLDESIYYISKNLKGSIPELFRIYRNSIIEGKSRVEAFGIIGRISYCSEFNSFIKVLYQSEVIGNPVKKILTDISRVYRNNQRDFLKMKSERIESNLIVVIFIFIFIPMLVIFLLPVLPQLKLIIG